MFNTACGIPPFVGAPDEGGEGKELLISPFSPYLSLPAGSCWGGGKAEDGQYLWGDEHKAYLHIREGGNLHTPKHR